MLFPASSSAFVYSPSRLAIYLTCWFFVCKLFFILQNSLISPRAWFFFMRAHRAHNCTTLNLSIEFICGRFHLAVKPLRAGTMSYSPVVLAGRVPYKTICYALYFIERCDFRAERVCERGSRTGKEGKKVLDHCSELWTASQDDTAGYSASGGIFQGSHIETVQLGRIMSAGGRRTESLFASFFLPLVFHWLKWDPLDVTTLCTSGLFSGTHRPALHLILKVMGTAII